MSGGLVLSANNPYKIKGGKWTVFRFFLVSVAYTVGWTAISSMLTFYKSLYGPQVLLQMNIAYFAPSIPLLLLSSSLDELLDQRLGIQTNLLIRLGIGLAGSAAICASFPFQPQSVEYLLGSITGLGLFCGLAFSASYQLVSRFANKNIIALGLGLVGSGPLVLVLQLALGIGEEPTHLQSIILFTIVAGVSAAGLVSSFSLLLRHWRAIDANAAGQVPYPEKSRSSKAAQQGLQGQPEGKAGAVGSDIEAQTLEEEEEENIPSGLRAEDEFVIERSLSSQFSLPILMRLSPLEPSNTLDVGEELDFFPGPPVYMRRATDSSGQLSEALSPFISRSHSVPAGGMPLPPAPRRRWFPHLFTPPRIGPQEGLLTATTGGYLPPLPILESGVSLEEEEPSTPNAKRAADHDLDISPAGESEGLEEAVGSGEGRPGGEEGSEGEEVRVDIWELLLQIWPLAGALFMGTASIYITFPFFTYVPTSARFGPLLPKVLFFSRLFADMCGRVAVRSPVLAVPGPWRVLLLACAMVAMLPLYFLYIKAAPFHDDLLPLGFVVVLWFLYGYVNSLANTMAPKLVGQQHKGAAAGLMAIAFQAAHVTGLLLAVILASELFAGSLIPNSWLVWSQEWAR